MIKYKISNFEKNIILLFCDIFIIIFSISLAYTLRLEILYPFWEIDIFVYLIVFSIFFLIFYLNNIYGILIRYFDHHSIKKIIKSIFFFQVILIFINLFVYKNVYFPRSVSFILPILIGIFIILSRVIISFVINKKFSNRYNHNNIMIIGVNNQTVSLFNNLRQNLDYGLVKCMLDDNDSFKKRELNGIKIYNFSHLYDLIEKYKINEIIIGTKKLSNKKKLILYDKLENKNIRIKHINYKVTKNKDIKKSLYR